MDGGKWNDLTQRETRQTVAQMFPLFTDPFSSFRLILFEYLSYYGTHTHIHTHTHTQTDIDANIRQSRKHKCHVFLMCGRLMTSCWSHPCPTTSKQWGPSHWWRTDTTHVPIATFARFLTAVSQNCREEMPRENGLLSQLTSFLEFKVYKSFNQHQPHVAIVCPCTAPSVGSCKFEYYLSLRQSREEELFIPHFSRRHPEFKRRAIWKYDLWAELAPLNWTN